MLNILGLKRHLIVTFAFNRQTDPDKVAAADSLVVEVLSLAVDLVFQGEVKGDVLHFLLDKSLGARGVLLLLQVLDHVGEPHRQTVVAGREGGEKKRERCCQRKDKYAVTDRRRRDDASIKEEHEQ